MLEVVAVHDIFSCMSRGSEKTPFGGKEKKRLV